MRNNGNHTTKRTSAAIGFIPAAVVMVLILSGCAAAQTKRDPAASLTPPKQASAQQPIPLPEPGPAPHSLAPTGSLWAPNSGSLYADVRAAHVGDILTITISENSSASKASTTTAERAKNFQGSLTFAGVGSASNASRGAFSFGPYNGAFSSNFKGDGTTTQNDSMTAYMTATVIDVLPSGNLLIRGSRWTKVNDELQQIVLEGVVRPQDISRNNTVLSQNVAEAKIFLLGKGPVAQHQKPGWLGQIWDFVSPF